MSCWAASAGEFIASWLREHTDAADLRAANWSLVEEGLDAQIAAYESFVDAMTGGGMRPTATPDRGFDADETPGPDR